MYVHRRCLYCPPDKRVSCVEIMDLLRVLWDVALNRAITDITTQGMDKSILYVDAFYQY